MLHVYIDNEFDAVRMHGKYLQQVIAIGAVLCDEQYRFMDTFYALIRPAGFQRLSHHVRKITHLRDEDIRKAEKFPAVIDHLIAWLQDYDDTFQWVMYSFGPDDRRTLCANAAFYHHDSERLFAQIIDLQTLLSSRIKWKGTIFQKTHSLESLKQIYQIHGDVNHNALSDARDLYLIHQAYREDAVLDEDKIAASYELLQKKKREGIRKRQQHQLQRCQALIKEQMGITMLLPPVVLNEWASFHKQLILLAEKKRFLMIRSLRKRTAPLCLKATYSVNNVSLCCWFRFYYQDQTIFYRITCEYHNIEAIHHFLKQWFTEQQNVKK